MSAWCGLGLARNVNSVIGGVPGDNLWSDSATGNFVSLGGSVTEG